MPELGEVRRARILELAAQQGSVRVAVLSQMFSVTPETIRREINRLAQKGQLARVHGGAVLPSGMARELPFQLRSGRQQGEKLAIAAEAAAMVEEGDIVALDASTTALSLGQELAQRGLAAVVVVTNAAELPLRLAEAPGVTVLCTGGTLRGHSRSYVGPQTVRALEGYRVRKTFLSCQGFTLADGPSETSEAEAEVKQALVRAAEEVVLMVDHTKWGRNALVPICPVGALGRVITDRPPPLEEMRALEDAGVALHVTGTGPVHPRGGTSR